MLMSSTMTALATMWLVATPAAQATPAPGETATAAPAPATPAAPGPPTTHRVTWDRSTAPDLSGYVVSWGDRPGVYTHSKRVGAQDTSTDLEVAPGATGVYVAIRAVDRAGVLSGYSNEIAIGQPGKAGSKKAGAKPAAKAKAAKKAPRTAEEKAELRRKKQERKKQKAAARAQAAKPKPKP